MPGVPSSPADGSRASGGDGNAETGLPRRLWTIVVLAAIQTWIVLGLLLGLLGAVGAPVPPAVTDARAYVPWIPQDAWSAIADVGWALFVSLVAASFLRRALRRRGTASPALPSLPDLAVAVVVAYAVGAVLWVQLFPAVQSVAVAVGVMLLVILLLRVREVWCARDVVGPWTRQHWGPLLVLLVLLVAPYAAWHPLEIQGVEVSTRPSPAARRGGSIDVTPGGEQWRGIDRSSSRIDLAPGATVTLRFGLFAGHGSVRLLAATPVVPEGALRLLPARRPRHGYRADGAPLPRRIALRSVDERSFRLRAPGGCDGGEQVIDRVRVRYRRLGSTVTTELRTPVPIELVCTR